MKVTSVFLTLLLVFILTAGGYQDPVNQQSIDNVLGESFTYNTRVTKDITPIIAVTIDDGRDDLVSLCPETETNCVGTNTPGVQGYRGMYWPFLKQGVPVTLAIHYNLLGSPGRATVADIQRIIAEFDSAGVAIEIAQHGNSNWVDATNMTYAELSAEIDPTILETTFGKEVSTLLIAGNASDFYRKNYWAIKSIAESHGIKYINGAYDGVNKTMRNVGWAYSSAFADGNPSTLGDVAERAIYPGVSNDPYFMPPVATIDIGNYWSERDPATQWTGHYDSWTITSDAGISAGANWGKTTTWLLNVLIANQWGFAMALHDSLSSLTDPTYIDGTGYGSYDGQWSPHHLAWQLGEYARAGHIRVGTCAELYEWGSSQIAPNTNLIPDQWNLPAFEIGDDVGVEVAWLPGFGSIAAGAAWSGVIWTGAWTDGVNTTTAKFGTDYPPNFTGEGLSAGYRGDPSGGFLAIQTLADNIRLARTNLPLGKYRIEWATNCDYMINRKFDLALAGSVAYYNQANPEGSYAYGDTLFVAKADGAKFLVNDSNGLEWRTYSIEFTLELDQIYDHLAGWGSGTNPTGWWRGGVFLDLEAGTGKTCPIDEFKLYYLGP